jgi:hypothetical protein
VVIADGCPPVGHAMGDVQLIADEEDALFRHYWLGDDEPAEE